jgi:hypothetical protein
VVRVAPASLEQLAKPALRRLDVVVHEHHERRLGGRDAGVACRVQPRHAFAFHVADPGAGSASDLLGHLSGGCGGAVVHDQHLVGARAEVLDGQRLERDAQVVRTIPRWHDHRCIQHVNSEE